MEFKGESCQKPFFDGICNNAKSLPKCQKPAFLTFINKLRFELAPRFPLLNCVPKINSTFYVLHQNAKNLPNRQSALSLHLCPFLEGGGGGGGRGHLKYSGYKGGGSTRKNF